MTICLSAPILDGFRSMRIRRLPYMKTFATSPKLARKLAPVVAQPSTFMYHVFVRIRLVSHDPAIVRHEHDEQQERRRRKPLNDAGPYERLHRIQPQEIEADGNCGERGDGEIEFLGGAGVACSEQFFQFSACPRSYAAPAVMIGIAMKPTPITPSANKTLAPAQATGRSASTACAAVSTSCVPAG